MTIKMEGIIPPLVTPFAKDGSINENMFRRIINNVIGKGVHGVFVAGSQGEFFSLERQERIRLFEIAVEKVNGKVPVYAGTAAITTSETVLLTKAAEKSGCDAVSIISPFFIKPNGQELYQYYKTVAEASNLPVLLYNNPNRTGYDIPVDIIRKLTKIDNIVGMKDSGGNLTYVNEVLRTTGPDFHFFCGRDTVIFNVLTSGGSGAVPASANVAPKLIVDLYNHVKSGNYEAARQAQYDLAPLRMAFSLGSFPVVIKEALSILGFDTGGARAPIQSLTPENHNRLAEVLKKMGLVK